MIKKNVIWPILWSVLCVVSFLSKSGFGQDRILLSNKIGRGVYVIDGSNLTVIREMPGECALAFALSGNNIYFIDMFLTPIFDKTTLAPKGEIEFAVHPTPGTVKAVVSPDGKKMYVGVIGWGRAEKSGIFAIDLEKKKEAGMVEEGPFSSANIEISRDGRALFIPEASEVKIINLPDNELIKNLRLRPNIYVQDIWAINNDEIYVSANRMDYKEQEKEGGFYDKEQEKTYGLQDKEQEKKYRARLYKINWKRNTCSYLEIEDPIWKFFVARDGKIYILTENEVLKINKDLKTINSISASGNNIACSPDGKRLYVVLGSTNTLSVYDAEKGSLIIDLS